MPKAWSAVETSPQYQALNPDQNTAAKQQNFDIGSAGPLAGFVVALAVIWYGFATLPPPEYVFQFHPEYQQYGLQYAEHVYSENLPQGTIDLITGKNLLFMFFENFLISVLAG